MTLSINRNTRFVSIDFETTWLDTQKDEPIQVWLVIANPDFLITDVYAQLIKPNKDIKELKHVVGYITWLELQQLSWAPEKQAVGKHLSTLLSPSDIIVGHNVMFDLAILKQCLDITFPRYADTFSLSQALIHYPPSYALEVLCEIDAVKTHTECFEQELKKRSHDLTGPHDALHDSVKALWLFRYLIHRIIELSEKYPWLDGIVLQSPSFPFLFGKDHSTLEVPILQKPIARPKQKILVDPSIVFDITSLNSTDSLYCGNQSLPSLLSLLVSNEPCILAFHTRQKVEFVKALLDKQGYNDVGFAKQEQYIDHELFSQLVHCKDLSDSEISFVLLYLSHHHQWLRVLDLHTRWDYSVFGLVKKEWEHGIATRILCTHWWLYSLLGDERYRKHRVFFLDSDRWHYSYNGYHSQTLDLDYVVDLIEAAHYRYHRLMELENKHVYKTVVDSLYELKHCFLVFLGSLSIEITKHFVGKPNKKLELWPILHDSSFFQTQQLWPRLAQLFRSTIDLIDTDAHYQLVREYNTLLEIVDHIVVVEKIMKDNRYLHYSFCLANTYIDFQEFKSLFDKHFVLFLSNQRANFPPLSPISKANSQKGWDIVTLRDMQAIARGISDWSIPWDCIFLLSNIKEESRRFFEVYSQWELSHYVFFVENINGWVGKITYLAQSLTGKKIIIWWYYFLLHLFAKMVKLDTIVVYNASGPMERVVLADVDYYGQART